MIEVRIVDVPEEYVDLVEEYKMQITEAVAMGDDELMEKFFSGEEFTDAQLTKGVRIGVRNGEIVPVFSGCATMSVGIERLMDLIIKYFPTYGEGGSVVVNDLKTNEMAEILCDEGEVMTARVFKTIVDPFVGKICYFRVYFIRLSSNRHLLF